MKAFPIHWGENLSSILRFGDMYSPFRDLNTSKKKKKQPLVLNLSSKQVPPDERISKQVKFSPGNLEIGVLKQLNNQIDLPTSQ